jgi:hypothetical protein
MTYVYYIDGNKFTTDDYADIPMHDISSPDENTPAYENLLTGYKVWCEKGFSWHRLTGPAYIDANGFKEFWLNDKEYKNDEEWIKDHPNPDLYFDAIGLTETDRVLWFLQN